MEYSKNFGRDVPKDYDYVEPQYVQDINVEITYKGRIMRTYDKDEINTEVLMYIKDLLEEELHLIHEEIERRD